MRIVFAAIAALANAALAQPSLQRELSPDQVREDLELAQEALARLHPGYDRYSPAAAIDGAFSAAMAHPADSVGALYLDISRITALIRCDHTKAELPDAAEDERETQPLHLPFRFRAFGTAEAGYSMVVDDPGDTGLIRGETILEIDGVAARDRIDAVLPLIPVDGFTDAVKSVALADTGEFLGSAFDHFDPMLNAVSPNAVLTVQGLDGAVREERVERIGYAAFREIGAGAPDGRRYRNFSDPDAARVTFPAARVAVLSVETFVNYRTPVDPDTVYAPLFQAVAEAETELLVLDLRRNGGGSTDAQQGLLSWLVTEPVVPVRDVRVKSRDLDGLREHISSWDRMAMNPTELYFDARADGWWSLKPQFGGGGQAVEPHPDAYAGRIAILTGPTNSSGATSLIAALAETGRATLVGEPTGGSQEGPTAGIIYFLKLPHSGIVVRVPWQLTVQNVEDPAFGQGFQPDIVAPLTYPAWLDGRDPALEAAIALGGAR
jgi:hypothetical protein